MFFQDLENLNCGSAMKRSSMKCPRQHYVGVFKVSLVRQEERLSMFVFPPGVVYGEQVSVMPGETVSTQNASRASDLHMVLLQKRPTFCKSCDTRF